MKIRILSLLAVAMLAACGGDAAHALAGNWSEQTGSEVEGMTVLIDGDTDKVFVHGRPRADGGHGHYNGTYTFDEKTMAVTVSANLLGDGKAGTWTGKLDGDALELVAADITLKFSRGGDAGH